jgi:single-strand DNA-binding protein
MSVNKVILIGNLGKDPEVKYLDGNRVVANVTLATNESYTDKSGQKVEQTEWHNLEMWDGLARIAEKYLQKGRMIYVEGKIKTDKWQDKEGNNRSTQRIRVLNMTLLGGTGGGSGSGSQNQNTGSNQVPSDSDTFAQPDPEDDLPF